MPELNDADLRAFLDEALPADQMSKIEEQLRADPALHRRLSAVRGQEEAGVHSLGAIWRRNRMSCPSREELGQFLLQVLEPDAADYIEFHIERVGCRYCEANIDDLRSQQSEASEQVSTRRKKYFQTSVGHMKTQ